MAGSNPFAPFAQGTKPLGAPQLPGIQAPNVAMQDTPGFVETVAPTMFTEAMGSDTAGKVGNYMLDGAKNAFSAFTKPSPAGGIPVSELSNTMGTAISPSSMLGGGAEGAIAAQQAAALSTASGAPAALMGATPAAFGGMAAGGAEAAIAAQAAAAASQAAAAGTALTGAATAGAGAAAASAAPLALMAGPFAPLVIGGAMLAAGK